MLQRHRVQYDDPSQFDVTFPAALVVQELLINRERCRGWLAPCGFPRSIILPLLVTLGCRFRGSRRRKVGCVLLVQERSTSLISDALQSRQRVARLRTAHARGPDKRNWRKAANAAGAPQSSGHNDGISEGRLGAWTTRIQYPRHRKRGLLVRARRAAQWLARVAK